MSPVIDRTITIAVTAADTVFRSGITSAMYAGHPRYHGCGWWLLANDPNLIAEHRHGCHGCQGGTL